MTYELLSDEDVFALVRDQNDEQAYRALYRRYDKRIYAYCLRALGNPEDARDVFQTISMTIYDKRESFSDGSFAAWLFTITRNMCLKTLRNRKADHRVHVEEMHEPEEREIALVRTSCCGKSCKKAIGSAVRRNSRKRWSCGTSMTCRMKRSPSSLNISVSLAKVRVFRAKKQITKILSPILDELQ